MKVGRGDDPDTVSPGAGGKERFSLREESDPHTVPIGESSLLL